MHAVQKYSSFHNKLATQEILLFYVTSAICLFIASTYVCGKAPTEAQPCT